MTKQNVKDNVEDIEIKDEKKGKVKNWVSKHKGKMFFGAGMLISIGGTAYAYKLGYGKGYATGFKEACNFNETEYTKRV